MTRITMLAVFACVAMTGIVSAQTQLTRETFLIKVLAANQSLQVRRLEKKVSTQQVVREEAAFDPVLSISGQYEDSLQQNTTEDFFRRNNLDLYQEKNSTMNLGVSGLLHSGTRYEAAYSVRRLRNSLSDMQTQYQANASLTITQPLLQNRGTDVTRARVRLTERDADIAHQELRSTTLSMVSEAESLYWDLVLAQDEIKLRTESVAMARTLYDYQEKRLELNKIGNLEVEQADVGLRMRVAQRTAAAQNLAETINRFRTLLSEPVTANTYVADDRPDTGQQKFDRNTVMQQALEHNPDYIVQKLELDKTDIRLIVADNMQWPRLDLVATYGQNGLDEALHQGHDFLVDETTNDWSVLLQFQMAIGNRQARSELEAARLRQQQAILNLKHLEIELGNAVDTVLGRIDTTYQQMQTLADVTKLNLRVLNDEQQLLENGRSNSRRILEAEEDLFEASQSEMRGRIDFQKAILTLATIEGTLLRAHGFQVEK
jgi:outer membrane protein TolC